MTYNTGSRDDWDHISRITEDPTWTWDAMAPYRDLNQRYVPPNDRHNDVSQKQAFSIFHSYTSSQTYQYLPEAHSRNGMVSISLPGYSWPSDARIAAATNDPGFSSEFPFQRDMNTGNTVRFITAVVLSGPFFDWLSFLWGRSVLDGRRPPSATASAAVLPLPTLDRSTLTARTCTSCFTFTLRSSLRRTVPVTGSLASIGLSLEPGPPVS